MYSFFVMVKFSPGTATWYNKFL